MSVHILSKVEEVKSQLIQGQNYLVPCLVKTEDKMLYITPIINHPHTDTENGQDYIHYHVDYRFVKHQSNGVFPFVINNHSQHHFVKDIRVQEKIHGELEYFVLPLINEDFAGITPVSFILNSKLKHKCIHQGKCPHKGYDLSQVKAVDGTITCPLHGLRFDSITGSVLNLPNKQPKINLKQ